MWILKTISIATLLSPSLLLVQAADCDASQPRKEGDPAGTEIAKFLSDAIDNPNSNICAGGFPPGNNNIATFSANLMTFNVTREDPSKPLENCKDAFHNIIDQCVQNDNFWGGSWSLNGFHYSIKNHVFPDDGIKGPDPVITAPPSTSTVLTETDSSGNVVTVTFVPSTVTEFTSLTTTTTITSTSTGNDGALIAVPLIIGIGGLVWIPLGGGPLPPGVTPPPTPPGPEGDNPDQPNSNVDVTITSAPASSTPAQSSASSTSSASAFPTVDSIGEPPLPDFQEIMKIEAVGSLPAEDTTPPDQPQGPTIDPHVGNVECFPTHGTNEADKIVSIAVTDTLIDQFCMGTEPNWQRVGGGSAQTEPAANNHYDATFTLASNAPELCKQLYTEQGKGNADVQNFCKSPLKAITHQCVFNGGKVTSDCGEWTLQSCPLGGRCKIGEPGKHCQTDPGNNFCL